MKNVAGVFRDVSSVRCAVEGIRKQGIPENRINAIAPGTSENELEADVPVSDTEQPGMGGALGGTVGAALGAAGGLELGLVAASFFVPGIGPVLAAGLGAVIFGAGGAIAGAAAGSKLEENIEGVPHDELFVYEDALRRGRSVVFVTAQSENEAKIVNAAFEVCGAESIDAARNEWWVGLRDDEQAYYEAASGRSFDEDEEHYRKGFESALDMRARGKSYAEDVTRLRDCFGDICEHDAFKHGYRRGREHCTPVK